jgi:4-aminobutyrate aminotransferase-like enzyme
MPPLTLTREEIDIALERLEKGMVEAARASAE